MTCAETRDRLDDYVDGALGGAELHEVELHIAGCAECAGQERELRALLAAAAALPSQMHPARDLWPGIAERIAATRRPAAAIAKRLGGPPRSLCSAPARRCWSTRCGCGTGRLRRTRPCRGTEPTDRGFTPGPCAANAVPRSAFPASWSL